MVFVIGVGGSFLFFSCGREDDAGDSSTSETTTSDGKDVTQTFTVSVTGVAITFPDGAFDRGTKFAVSTTGSPTEFKSNADVEGATAAALLQATDSNAQAVAKAKKPFTVTLDLNDAAALTPVERTGKNVCVLGLGNDHVLRLWKFEQLVFDETAKKLTFNAIWLGHYQALYCGTNFDAVAAVNAKGDALAGEVSSNACNYVGIEGYGYCMTYYGSNLVGTKESVTELQKTCEAQKGEFGTSCDDSKVVGYCVFGSGTKSEIAWSWYEASLASKGLETMKSECSKSQGKWFEAGAYTPTPEAEQK